MCHTTKSILLVNAYLLAALARNVKVVDAGR